MKLTVLSCSGSESPSGHTCCYRIGERTLLEMGSAASALPLPEQSRIRDVFVSHAHLDHVKDLAFFAENVLQAFEETVNVRGTAETLGKIQRHLLNGVIWPDFTQIPNADEPVLRYVPFQDHEPIAVEGNRVRTVPVNHPGGCEAFFLESADGTVVYSGDTGPTEALWAEVNRQADRIRAILLETSFPNRLPELAHVSGHLTPQTLAAELAKLEGIDAPVYVHHIKAPTRDETVAELEALGDPRIRILEPGTVIEF